MELREWAVKQLVEEGIFEVRRVDGTEGTLAGLCRAPEFYIIRAGERCYLVDVSHDGYGPTFTLTPGTLAVPVEEQVAELKRLGWVEQGQGKHFLFLGKREALIALDTHVGKWLIIRGAGAPWEPAQYELLVALTEGL